MLKVENKSGSGEFLLKTRLGVYVLALLHLLYVALDLLNKDFSGSSDPKMRAYATVKWKLLTTWFNLLHGLYMVLSIYCIWNEMKQNQSKHVNVINKSKNFLFSSIILPITAFGDVMFWGIYIKDKTLLMPVSASDYISVWNQHSLHTITLLFVLFELIFVPRNRPKNMKAEIIALASFLTVYMAICIYSAINGEYVYPAIGMFPMSKLVVGFIYVYTSNFFYYTGQWIIVDIIWAQRGVKIKVPSK